ncbi:hypothetical protein ACFQQB_64610 [Nonomuraea rubra]
MQPGSAKKWLRGGLLALAALQTVASVWQYVFPAPSTTTSPR